MAAAAPPPKQAPKFPNPRNVAACVDYLIAYWAILGGESPASKDVSKRLAEAKVQKTPQLAIARAIYLGPSPAMAGAERWGRVAIALQEYVKAQTGEKGVASRLGGALADVAGTVAHAASTAADSATGAAKAAATAVAVKAGELSTLSIPTPGDFVSSVMEIPGSLAKKVADKISETFPGVGTALKVVLGLGATAAGGVGLVGLGLYAGIILLSIYGGFYLAPRWAFRTLKGMAR